MKYWKTSEKQFLLVSDSSIGIIEDKTQEELQQLINENNISKLLTLPLNELKELIFIDTDKSIEICTKDDELEDIDIEELEESVYNDLKSFLMLNFKGVEIKDYTMLKQLKYPSIGLLFFTFLTWMFYNTAKALENEETVRISGRRGFIKKIFVWIADLLGTTGSLVIGGLLIALFLYVVIKIIAKPKEGKVLKVGNLPKIQF